MEIVTPQQMKNIDARAIEMGVPSLLLMENAASAVVSELPAAKSHLIVCGSGNNGGDGYAIARQLFCANKKVSVLKVGEPKTDDAKINYKIAVELGIPFVTLEELDEYDVIVDALFGTGISGEVRPKEQEIINFINNSGSYICSVDMPSGTDGKSGQTCGVSVKANKTVTFARIKQGQMWTDNTGKLILKDISIPPKAIEEENIKTNGLNNNFVKKLFPERRSDAHKGSCGKVFVVAGSEGMTGAARLCCEAALRSGAGLLRLAIPKSLNVIMEKTLTEAMTVPVDEADGSISADATKQIVSCFDSSDVLLIGCGLSTKIGVKKAFFEVVSNCNLPMVIDADGLNILAENPEVIKGKDVVVTPHPVEFSRLSGMSLDEINKDRVKAASDLRLNTE